MGRAHRISNIISKIMFEINAELIIFSLNLITKYLYTKSKIIITLLILIGHNHLSGFKRK